MEIKYFTNTAVTELNNLDELKNKREITFAGILREVTHAQSKTGSPFGKFTIEDLEGTHTMTIFSKTYTSIKEHLQTGYFVYCRAMVGEKMYANEKGELELKLTEMMLLEGVMDKYSKGIIFSIKVEDVDEEFCSTIETLTNKHKGKSTIAIVVEDSAEDISLTMKSEKKVNIKAMIAELKKIEKIRKIEIVR